MQDAGYPSSDVHTSCRLTCMCLGWAEKADAGTGEICTKQKDPVWPSDLNPKSFSHECWTLHHHAERWKKMFKKLELLISYLQTVNSSLVAQEAEQVIYQSDSWWFNPTYPRVKYWPQVALWPCYWMWLLDRNHSAHVSNYDAFRINARQSFSF